MSKFLKGLMFLGIVANLMALLYFIDDSKSLRQQISEVNNIRVQLPEEFRKAVADQTLAATKELVKDELELAAKAGVVNEALVRDFLRQSDGRVARAMCGLTNRYDAALARMESVALSSANAIAEVVREHDQKKIKKISDAEAAYATFLKSPTNELAILFLQVAIRKNPTDLKYIKAMKDVVDQSGFDPGLIQEYQSMLSYCLDETSENCMDELVLMVKDLRNNIARMEISEGAPNTPQDSVAVIAGLREQLESNSLILSFDEEARKAAERRVELLKELSSMDGETEMYGKERETAELIVMIAKADDQIKKYVKQAKWEIAHAGEMRITQDVELRNVLEALGATAVSQPMALAQQMVQSLYAIDLSAQPSNVVKVCVQEFRALDQLVQNSMCDADKMKAEKIVGYVFNAERLAKDPPAASYTDQLKQFDHQGKIISKHIACISNAGIANEVLERQLQILEKTRVVQRERMKAYQTYAAQEMKEIAKLIKKYKDDAWRKEYKKNQAVPLLKRLVKIDPALLVPEINELYQYEYSQLTTDFNAWIEKENAYEYKAAFMVELEGIEKRKLEDL